MKRRDFLRASAVGGAGMLATSVWSRGARAAAFGEIPAEQTSSMLPENLRAESVLECFLLGGATPWESYYCVPERGQADETWAHTNYDFLIKAAEGCGFANAAAAPFTFFANDSAGQEVFFGPYLRRLLERPDVLARTRVVVNRHALVTHEAAIALAATGGFPSNPATASLATHVSRYFVERDPEAAHLVPFSYVFTASGAFTFSEGGTALAAQGLHPGYARPLRFQLDNAARLQSLLNRPTLGTAADRSKYDALSRLYFEQYAQSLALRGEPVRAERFSELMRAFAQQTQLGGLQALLPASVFQPLVTPKSCEEVVLTPNGELAFAPNSLNVTAPSTGNLPAMGLRLATQLLTNPGGRARYCAVVDAGVRSSDGGGGYDTHRDGPWRQATSFDNLLQYLLASINEPGASDPSKLDLDETLIILNTEFGRSPGRQTPGSQGRNHWPHGYAQIYIGGPIREGQAGVYGNIDEDGYATEFTTPAENRIAALLALGIYPFSADAYSSAHVQADGGEGAAARSVISRVFGREV